MVPQNVELFDVDGSIISYVYSLGAGKLSFASHTNGGTFAPSPIQLTFSPNDLTFDLTGNLYFAADFKIYKDTLGGPVVFDDARGGSQIVASEKFLYLLNGAAVIPVPLQPGNAQSNPLTGPPFARLASNRLHAFASSSGPTAMIYRFDDGGPVAATTYQAIADVVGDPIALAVDPDHVYWIDKAAGTAAIRKSVYAPTPGVGPTTVVAGYSEIAGLVVDQSIGGCLYFWGQDASNVAALRVAPKGP